MLGHLTKLYKVCNLLIRNLL